MRITTSPHAIGWHARGETPPLAATPAPTPAPAAAPVAAPAAAPPAAPAQHVVAIDGRLLVIGTGQQLPVQAILGRSR